MLVQTRACVHDYCMRVTCLLSSPSKKRCSVSLLAPSPFPGSPQGPHSTPLFDFLSPPPHFSYHPALPLLPPSPAIPCLAPRGGAVPPSYPSSSPSTPLVAPSLPPVLATENKRSVTHPLSRGRYFDLHSSMHASATLLTPSLPSFHPYHPPMLCYHP